MHGEQEIQQDAEEEDKGRGRQVTLRDLGAEQHLGHREAGVRLDSQGEQGPTFARGRSPSSPVCVVEGGVEWRDRSCPLPGRGVNDPRSVHLSSPRGKGGAGRECLAPGSPGVREDREASSGHRGKEGRRGPGRAGRALPARVCPVLQRKCCQGRRGGGRKWAGGSC